MERSLTVHMKSMAVVNVIPLVTELLPELSDLDVANWTCTADGVPAPAASLPSTSSPSAQRWLELNETVGLYPLS